MQTHRFMHRITGPHGSAQGVIRTRKAFDVAAARKMLREGRTLTEIGEAQGMTAQTVRNRLRSLGLSYLVSDPIRIGQSRSAGQRAKLAREAASK